SCGGRAGLQGEDGASIERRRAATGRRDSAVHGESCGRRPVAAPHQKERTTLQARAPSSPAAGSVSTHAITIRCATCQRTAATRRAAPTPTIAPVMVWVVETGTPNAVARKSVNAPPVSAQKPWMGFKWVIREPM